MNSIELMKIAKSGDYQARIALAKKAKTSSEILDLLSKDRDWLVRCAVAANANTTEETLIALAVSTIAAIKLIRGLEATANHDRLFDVRNGLMAIIYAIEKSNLESKDVSKLLTEFMQGTRHAS